MSDNAESSMPALLPATRQLILLASVMAALVAALYLPALHYPFIFDDEQSITENPSIRVTELTWPALAKAMTESYAKRRPLANLTFALNYYFSGYDPAPYRAVNLLVHWLNGMLVFLSCWLLLRRAAMLGKDRDRLGAAAGKRRLGIAAATGLIWLVHPIQIQGVTYIVQRMTSMAVLFFLAAFCLYMICRESRGRAARRLGFSGCGVLFVLGMACKEIVVSLPAILFLAEWYFFQDLDRHWLKRAALWLAGPVVIVGCVALVRLGHNPLDALTDAYKVREFTAGERVMTQFRVLVFYWSLLALPLPSRLTLDHYIVTSTGMLTPLTTTLSLVTHLGVLTAAVMLAKRQRLISFCILWFYVNLALESSFIRLEMIYEHRLYLPSICCALLAVAFAGVRLPRALPQLRVALSAATLLALAAATAVRNRDWRDPLVFWTDCLEKAPDKARTHSNYGFYLHQVGRNEEAIRAFRQALKLNPGFLQAHHSLGVTLQGEGDLEQAMQHYKWAIEIHPKYTKSYVNLGVCLTKLGRFTEAETTMRKAIELAPENADAWMNLGNLQFERGDYEAAIETYQHSLVLGPRAPTYNGLAAAYLKQGKLPLAFENFRQALALDPAYVGARDNLVEALNREGRRLIFVNQQDQAMPLLQESLRLHPTAQAANDIGVIHGQRMELPQAIAFFSRAVDLDPAFGEAVKNLAGARTLLQPQAPQTTPEAP